MAGVVVSGSSAVCGCLACVKGIIPQQVADVVNAKVSYVMLYSCNVEEIQKMNEDLKDAKEKLGERLRVAQTNGDQNTEDSIEKWLELTDRILVSELELKKARFCCGSAACKAGEVLNEMKKALESYTGLGPSSGRMPPPIGSLYHAYNKSLLSREDILAEIFTTLKDSNMIGLYGIRGVGKTTLLQELVKRAEAGSLFWAVDMIDLSQGVTVKSIQDSIAQRIQLHFEADSDEKSRAQLLYRGLNVKPPCAGRPTLLIFDNVCSLSGRDFERIGIPFLGDESCKILVSARSLDVCVQIDRRIPMCKTVQLDCLTPDEANVLFRDTLGNLISDEQCNREAYISNRNSILRSCGNLPLAIKKTVLALMRRIGLHEIVRNLTEYDLSQDETVKAALFRVYNSLLHDLEDPNKQKIFLLCCLFEQGTSIPVESLMRYGLGLNLFSTVTRLDDIMEQANLLVNRFKSLVLLQSMDGYVSMSAMPHKFAISTALKEKYLLIDEGDRNDDTRKNFSIISSTTKPEVHGSEDSESACHRHLNGLNSPKLEALFLKGGFLNVQDFDFAGMNNLRVLVMTDMNLPSLPQSIESLKNLLTLCVEDCKIQNASVDGVWLGLQVLSFHGSTLGAYPADIIRLKNLIVLDLAECKLGTSPDNTDALFRYDLNEFDKLEELEIEIAGENADHLPARLSSFKIAIGCKFPSSRRSLPDRTLFLQDIDQRTCSKNSLRNLLEKAVTLNLVNIENLGSVYFSFSSIMFVNLKFLHISRCNQMTCVLNGNGDGDVRIVPNLEHLSLEKLEGLVTIYSGTTKQNWPSQLRELKLFDLEKLKFFALHIQHARNLVVVEVRDCPKLNYFFSTYSTSETGYDLPFLKKLDLHRLPALKGMWTDKKKESDITDQTDQLLFHEKISLPSLEVLHLSGLDSIMELWSNISAESPAFRSLKEISIDDCKLLKRLCTLSVLAALSGLVTLEISSSSNMKEIMKIDTNSGNAINVPEHRCLELNNLQCLQLFSQRQTPFIEKILFSKLEHLKLTDMEGTKKLVEEVHCATAFPNMKTLTIIKLGKLECLPAGVLENIEELKIHTCGSLQGLFDRSFETSMLNLTMLELVDVGCCENVPWKLIPNIQSLVIRCSLRKLQCMVSTTEIFGSQVAQKLSYMEIEGCDDLREIVSDECDQENQDSYSHGTTMFPRLKHIKFHALPRIITFSSGRYDTTFSNLVDVEIIGCPKLQSFSSGVLHTAGLSTLILDGVHIPITEEERDLNSILNKRNQGNQQPQDGREQSEELLQSTDLWIQPNDDNGGAADYAAAVGGAAANNDDEHEMRPSESQLPIDDDSDVDSVVAANDDDEHKMHPSRSLIVIDDNGGADSAASDDGEDDEHEMRPSGSLLATNNDGDAQLSVGTNNDDAHEMSPSESQLTTNDDGDAHSAVAGNDDYEQEMHLSKSPIVPDDDGAADSASVSDNGVDHIIHNSGSAEVWRKLNCSKEAQKVES